MSAENPCAEAAAVTILLPDVLVRLFPGAAREVRVAAANVRDAIEELDARWPGMKDRLCDSTPALRRHVNVFVNGRRAALETPLAPGTELVVLPAISGGRGGTRRRRLPGVGRRPI